MVDYNMIISGIIYTIYSNRRYIVDVVREMVSMGARRTKRCWVIEGSRATNFETLYIQGNVDKAIKEIDSKYYFGYYRPYIERKTLKYINSLSERIDEQIVQINSGATKENLEETFSIDNVPGYIYNYIRDCIKNDKDIHITQITLEQPQ